MEIIIYEILILIFIALSAIFSGTETSLISANRIKLKALSEKGNQRADRVLDIIDNTENALGTILIGNNLANVAATAFIVFVLTKTFLLNETKLLIITIIQTIIFLIFCEILPKTIARSKAESYLLLFSYPISMLMLILRPIIKIALFFSKKIKAILNLESIKYPIISSRDEIGTLFKLGESEGIIDEDHRHFVSEILSFREVTANEVMTPTIDIISTEKKQSIRYLAKLIEKTRFSRIPIYEDRVDNIIGYVHYRDLLKNNKIKKIDEVIKKPYFVPATKMIYELFMEMQKSETPIVFVVNEFGAVEGLITYEDIAEEIVGEIQTRDHPDEELIKKINDKKYILCGSLDIDFFQRKFGLSIEKKRFETVAGFITYKLGKIPKKGDQIEYEDYTFIVDAATDRSVESVILKKTIKRKKR